MKQKTFSDFLDGVSRKVGWATFGDLKTNESINTTVNICTEAAQLYADYCVEKAGEWVSGDEFPDLLTHQGESSVVLAKVEGYRDLLLMRAIFWKEDDGYIVWARVYDGLDGDAHYDESYNVIRWQPLPNAPKP